MGFDLNQFCAHTNASNIVGANELQKGSNTRPPVLNSDSEATVVMRMANTIRAIWASMGNLVSSPSINLKYRRSHSIFQLPPSNTDLTPICVEHHF
jgi:hypothetical protein